MIEKTLQETIHHIWGCYETSGCQSLNYEQAGKFLKEYMLKIGLVQGFDDESIHQILSSFEIDGDLQIDKDEMHNLIAVLLYKKDELIKVCEGCQHQESQLKSNQFDQNGIKHKLMKPRRFKSTSHQISGLHDFY